MTRTAQNEARCEDCRYCHAVLPEAERWYCAKGIGHGGAILRTGGGKLSHQLTKVRNCQCFASRFVKVNLVDLQPSIAAGKGRAGMVA